MIGTGIIQMAPELFADGFMFLEAPKWRDGMLWTSDVFAHEVHALSGDGQRRRMIEIPNRPSGLGFLSDGSLIIVSAKDRRLLRLDGETLAEYADLSAHAAGWVNDFAIDPLDRIFVGNFGYDFVAGAPRRTTSLHRVEPDRVVRTVADGLDFPNGSAVINDGRTLVVAETWKARLTAFDMTESGGLENRRVFADLEGRQPDGLCADAEGAIWVGIYNTGEFLRVLDGGRITNVLQFAGSGISCTLGGADGHSLFMTAFIGTSEEMGAGARKSAIYTIRADIPAP